MRCVSPDLGQQDARGSWVSELGQTRAALALKWTPNRPRMLDMSMGEAVFTRWHSAVMTSALQRLAQCRRC